MTTEHHTREQESAVLCPVSPSGEHTWVDDYGVGEGECLWCMARTRLVTW